MKNNVSKNLYFPPILVFSQVIPNMNWKYISNHNIQVPLSQDPKHLKMKKHAQQENQEEVLFLYILLTFPQLIKP